MEDDAWESDAVWVDKDPCTRRAAGTSGLATLEAESGEMCVRPTKSRTHKRGGRVEGELTAETGGQTSTYICSLLECAAHGRSSQCGTRGFLGSPPNPTYIWFFLECAAHGRSSQCGTRGFLGSPPNPTYIWSLLECAAPGRSSQCGTLGFPGITANPQHTSGPSWSVRLLAAPRSVGPADFLGSPPTRNTHLVPPGVCGSRPLLPVWDQRFSWAHRQPTTPNICLNTSRKTFVTQCPQPKCQHNHSHRRDRHETNRITAPHQQSAHINSEQLLPCR